MAKQSALHRVRSTLLIRYIPNPKERRLVVLTLGTVAVLLVIALYFVTHFYQDWIAANSRAYKGWFKQLGSIAQIGFFTAISIYPIFLLLKWNPLKQIVLGKYQLKTLLQFLGKWVRHWHVPIAITSAGFVLLHGYMAILKELKWDFTYFSGILSLIALFPLMFMGLKRFKRQDKKLHFKMAIVFLILFMIHASFG
ncbi:MULTISPECIES: hypothetical protein [unclassified Bacillus (in: firmicutes)]|uniref:hypothetical protein n=1 Tax=unclassified Bacillus (in: firmicutes) TaxID=185979 RepID=UPI0008EDCE27|nr:MULTISPECIES: hypothetical protein [unclassified Bacillus (in: firmicutes)]SFA69765.1 hypothetical protein SAMN02799634_10152 [Bacillus sp. UNCCL13]SFQ59123.1 hypothetical protein SAMN04488577_0336 [Bacillus sp. cl95]